MWYHTTKPQNCNTNAIEVYVQPVSYCQFNVINHSVKQHKLTILEYTYFWGLHDCFHIHQHHLTGVGKNEIERPTNSGQPLVTFMSVFGLWKLLDCALGLKNWMLLRLMCNTIHTTENTRPVYMWHRLQNTIGTIFVIIVLHTTPNVATTIYRWMHGIVGWAWWV